MCTSAFLEFIQIDFISHNKHLFLETFSIKLFAGGSNRGRRSGRPEPGHHLHLGSAGESADLPRRSTALIPHPILHHAVQNSRYFKLIIMFCILH